MDQLPETEIEMIESQDFSEPSVRQRRDPMVVILKTFLPKPSEPATPEQKRRSRWVLAILFIVSLGPFWTEFHYTFHDKADLFFKSNGVSLIRILSNIFTLLAVYVGFIAVTRLAARVPVSAELFKVLSFMTANALLCTFLSSCLPEEFEYMNEAKSS
ncbi:hypothetical protein G9P44_005108 [Scheffersomyces stipitis]|nr:hypothetical protein G9P44_005108 [Scheffersomyces stipitis]